MAGGRRDDRAGESCQRASDCPDWLFATLELPAGHDPATIEVASLRLFGSVAADPGYHAIVDTDRDGLPELRVRFAFDAVAAAPLRRRPRGDDRGAGRREPRCGGPAGSRSSRSSTSLRVTPRTLQRRSCGEEVLARITFADGVAASQVDIGSVRLNGVVPVERVVHVSGRELKVKFDRAAVIGILLPGASVEVRVTGTIRGAPVRGCRPHPGDRMRTTESRETSLALVGALVLAPVDGRTDRRSETSVRGRPRAVQAPAQGGAGVEPVPGAPPGHRAVAREPAGPGHPRRPGRGWRGPRWPRPPCGPCRWPEGEATLEIDGAREVVRPGSRVGGDTVKSVEPGRLVLERPAKPGQPGGPALVIVTFDEAGRAKTRVFWTTDPEAPRPAEVKQP